MKKESEVLRLFANRIKLERLKRNLSQEEFAELTGFHRNYIGMVERAERNLTLENIEKFAKALNLKLKELLDFDEAE
jgi:transcriptional regulator with XRE-family HTH domain